eukprot:GILJ01011565.1.p1 GENE.GILJ01011565.1~~GILJ01011565.1.p1  ORF type:complete len:296 (+),score=31.17 GILJ01011565.1:125-1012(+)
MGLFKLLLAPFLVRGFFTRSFTKRQITKSVRDNTIVNAIIGENKPLHQATSGRVYVIVKYAEFHKHVPKKPYVTVRVGHQKVSSPVSHSSATSGMPAETFIFNYHGEDEVYIELWQSKSDHPLGYCSIDAKKLVREFQHEGWVNVHVLQMLMKSQTGRLWIHAYFEPIEVPPAYLAPYPVAHAHPAAIQYAHPAAVPALPMTTSAQPSQGQVAEWTLPAHQTAALPPPSAPPLHHSHHVDVDDHKTKEKKSKVKDTDGDVPVGTSFYPCLSSVQSGPYVSMASSQPVSIKAQSQP